MNIEKSSEIIKTFDRLKTDRSPLETYWRDSFKYTFPERSQLLTNNGAQGDSSTVGSSMKDQSAILDGTAAEGCVLLASSMVSGLTPSSSQWVKMGVEGAEEDDLSTESKTWLDKSAQTIHSSIHSSNYDAQVMEFCIDIVVGGLSGLYIEMKDGALYFEQWPLDGLYVLSMLSKERIDTIYRICPLTALEAEDKFGRKNLPEHIQKLLETDPYNTKKHEFIHTIRPRIKKNGKQSQGSLLKTSLPFESVYVCKESKQIVSESGFHEFPVIIPRWMNIPNTDYAIGPMHRALPDTKTLNKLVELLIRGNEMAILPPWAVKDDGVVNPHTVVLKSGRLIPVDDMNNLKPLHSGAKFEIATAEITRLQNQIKRQLMSDILQPLEKAQATAEEVRTRQSIIRKILAPVYSRLQAEFLTPLLIRVLGLLYRAGKILPATDELRGKTVKFTFLSPQALAQRMEDIGKMDQYESSLGVQVQVNPTVLDNYDLDGATRMRADLLGVPAKLMIDPRKVKKLREERAQAQQQALMAQQIQPS